MTHKIFNGKKFHYMGTFPNKTTARKYKKYIKETHRPALVRVVKVKSKGKIEYEIYARQP